MRHRPTFDQFSTLSSQHTHVPVFRQLLGDALTPVTVFRKLQATSKSAEPRGFLFESVVGGERVGRYSFVGVKPFRILEASGVNVRVKDGDKAWQHSTHEDPLRLLEEMVALYRAPHVPGLPRFCGGAVGYAGYDTVRYVEHLPNAPRDDRQIPDLSFAFFDEMVIFDHVAKTVLAVSFAHLAELPAKAAYEQACKRVDDLVHQLTQPGDDVTPKDIDIPANYSLSSRYHSNFTRESWHAMMARGIEYINAGDIFQYVPSQRFETKSEAAPFDIYRALRVVNPSPFMFFVQAGSVTLVGASPEIMCRVENGQMTVRPLAGTRKRGATAEEDARLAEELLADPKERAEHIMLVDLGRNDVGKVCELGSVQISDLMTIERYSHVMHISSTVTGTLQKGLTAFDALRSALPAGTLSGAPKVRAMEIIDELEPHRRGPYGGAVGYIDFSGNMDTCIALRTMVIQNSMVYIQAGCGVVADSNPDSEYQETVNKAMGLMKALEVAEEQL